MGAGASFQPGNSLANRKFRKLILLKAYNKRDRSISVRQQFLKLVQTDSDDSGRQDGGPGGGHQYIRTCDLLGELGMGDEQMLVGVPKMFLESDCLSSLSGHVQEV